MCIRDRSEAEPQTHVCRVLAECAAYVCRPAFLRNGVSISFQTGSCLAPGTKVPTSRSGNPRGWSRGQAVFGEPGRNVSTYAPPALFTGTRDVRRREWPSHILGSETLG